MGGQCVGCNELAGIPGGSGPSVGQRDQDCVMSFQVQRQALKPHYPYLCEKQTSYRTV